MPQSVKLSDELIKQARHYGAVYHRSTAKQIEYWSTIGKISEENQDLPYSLSKIFCWRSESFSTVMSRPMILGD
jgi:hypothetical protein